MHEPHAVTLGVPSSGSPSCSAPPARGATSSGRRGRGGRAGPRVVLALLAATGLLDVADPASASPSRGEAAKDAALAAAVRTRRLPEVVWSDVALDPAVAWLRVATGWNFHVRRPTLEKAGVELAALRFSCRLEDVTVAAVLRLLFEPHGIVWTVKGNVVHLTTKADAMGKPYLVIHAIGHLTWTKTNFRGPRIDLLPSGFADDDAPAEEEDESDPFRDPQHVVDLVKQMVEAPWGEPGWSIAATKVYLTVRAPRSVQAEVALALARMAALK